MGLYFYRGITTGYLYIALGAFYAFLIFNPTQPAHCNQLISNPTGVEVITPKNSQWLDLPHIWALKKNGVKLHAYF
jgi:hypothetical protein